MIIKSSQRSEAGQLAQHLINNAENEQVLWSDNRDLFANSVAEALQDMEDMARGSRCQKPLYHVSLNPEQPMQEKDWQLAWDVFEAEYGLEQQPFIEVTHLKNDRIHKHRVYERVTLEGTAIPLAFTKLRNEKISRLLEYALNHPLTVGRHNRAVINALRRDELDDVANWLERAGAANQNRPTAMLTHDDCQQQRHAKLPVTQVKVDLRQAYDRTATGNAFSQMIAEQGYILAHGDRLDFVIVDRKGGLHSPRRRLGVKAKDLRQRWGDLDVSQLPTIAQVKEALNPDLALQKAFKKVPASQALDFLLEEAQKLSVEMNALHNEIQHVRNLNPPTVENE